MIKIGKIPIVHHIIQFYQYYGFKDFILATGYKKEFLDIREKKIVISNIIESIK